MESLHAFCEWLEATDLSQVIQTVTWIIPTVQTIHILAIAAVMSSVAMVDLRLLGLIGRGEAVDLVARRFVPWIWFALPVLLVTGSVLVIGEPSRSLENPAFQTKMALLLLAIAATLLFQRPLRRDAAYWEETPARRNRGRALAIVSLALWIGIVFAGRWIAYMLTA